MIKPKNLPRDPNSRAFKIMQYATGQIEPTPEETTIPREVFTKSGSEGGKLRAERLSSGQRSKIAKNAAKARWSKKKPSAKIKAQIAFHENEIEFLKSLLDPKRMEVLASVSEVTEQESMISLGQDRRIIYDRESKTVQLSGKE